MIIEKLDWDSKFPPIHMVTTLLIIKIHINMKMRASGDQV